MFCFVFLFPNSKENIIIIICWFIKHDFNQASLMFGTGGIEWHDPPVEASGKKRGRDYFILILVFMSVRWKCLCLFGKEGPFI